MRVALPAAVAVLLGAGCFRGEPPSATGKPQPGPAASSAAAPVAPAQAPAPAAPVAVAAPRPAATNPVPPRSPPPPARPAPPPARPVPAGQPAVDIPPWIADPSCDGRFAAVGSHRPAAGAQADQGRVLAAARSALIQRFARLCETAWQPITGSTPAVSRSVAQAVAHDLENQLIAASRQGAGWTHPTDQSLHVRTWIPVDDLRPLLRRASDQLAIRWKSAHEAGQATEAPSPAGQQRLTSALLAGAGLR